MNHSVTLKVSFFFQNLKSLPLSHFFHVYLNRYYILPVALLSGLSGLEDWRRHKDKTLDHQMNESRTVKTDFFFHISQIYDIKPDLYKNCTICLDCYFESCLFLHIMYTVYFSFKMKIKCSTECTCNTAEQPFNRRGRFCARQCSSHTQALYQ